MAVNYYYEVDENGKVTKKRKTETDTIRYEVDEDGGITVVPSGTKQEMSEDVAKTSMYIAQALNSTLLGQSQMQTGSTPYAPILQQPSGKDRLKSPSEWLADREKNAAIEEERKQAERENAAQTATIRPTTEADKAAMAAQKQQDMLAKITGRYFQNPTLYYYEEIPQKVNDIIESYKNGVPDERNPRLRTTPKNVFGYRSGDDYSKERAQEYAKENPGEVAYFVGSGNQVRAYYSEKGEEPISILLQGRQDLEEKQTWLQKGSFEDGYQFGDVLKGGWATLADVVSGFEEGFASSVEGISDLIGYGVAWGADKLGYEDYADDVRFRAQENTVADWFAEQNANAGITENSFLGEKGRGVPRGLGQLGFLWATAGLGKTAKAASAISTGTMFSTSMGSGMSEAYRDDATDEEAFKYGVMRGAVEAVTERMFAGTGKAFGNVTGKAISKLDDAAARKIGDSITRVLGTGKGAHATKVTAELITKAGFEGAEEFVAGFGDAIAKKLTYMSDEELSQLLADQNLMDQFITGMLVSTIAQGGDVNTAIKDGTDLITGRTEIEDAVVNKEYEKRVAEAEKDGKLTAKEKRKILEDVERDFAEGGISIDTIEEALGGDTYTEYQNAVNEQEAMQKEYDELYNRKNGEKSDADADRQAELKQKLDELKNKSKADEIHKRLSDEVFTKAQNSRLMESYAERERRRQKFEADLSKYENPYAKQTVKNAIDSGLMHNGRDSHTFVDFSAKVAADQSRVVRFTTTELLQKQVENGNPYKLDADPKDIEAFVSDSTNELIVNLDAKKSFTSLIGHEITDTMRKTKHYSALQKASFAFAKTKGEYNTRLESVKRRYAKINADIDGELTSDIVGDYLATEYGFIQNLAVNHQNVFQRVWKEINHLYKLATAGSKEARQLEQMKHNFEKAYRESANAKNNTAEDGGVKYHIGVDANGNKFVDVTEDIFDANDGESVARTIQKVIAKKFNNRIEANGQTFQINKTTNDEFRRSESATELLESAPQIYNDKLKTIANADEILATAKNWIGEKIKHNRKDDIIEFGRGNVLYRVNGNGYVADVLVGIRKNGAAVLYDLVNIYETKIAEGPVTVASNNNSQRRQGTSAVDIIAENSEKSSGNSDVRYSISEAEDSQGHKLTAEQAEYFKDSKIRDENGNLLVVYHGTRNGGFTKFNPKYSDDGTTIFLTPSKELAETYSGSAENVNLPEGKKGLARLLEKGTEKGNGQVGVYEVYANAKNPYILDGDGAKWNALPFNEKVKGKTNLRAENSFDAQNNTLTVNVTVDGKTYNNVFDFNHLDGQVKQKLESLESRGIELDELDYAREMAKLAQGEITEYYNQMFDEGVARRLINNSKRAIQSAGSDAGSFTGLIDNKTGDVTVLNTRNISDWAKENGYDAVWFKNIRDNGGKSSLEYSDIVGDVMVVFDGTQIKSVDNTNPTNNPDIRYSLSSDADTAYLDAVNRGDMETAQKMVAEAAKKAGYTIEAYHGTRSDFTVFDKNRVGKGNDQYGAGFYFASDKEAATHYGGRVVNAALNIKNPIRITATSESGTNLINADITLTSEQAYEVVKRHPDIYDAEESPLGDYYDSYWEVGAQEWMIEDLAEQYRDVGYLDSDLFRNYPNELHEALQDVTGYDGVEVTFERTGEKFYVAWFDNQMKSTEPVTYDDNGNVIPLSERFNTEDNDIRHYLSAEGETTKEYGNFNIYGKDVRYTPTMEDLPIRDDVTPVQDTVQDTVQPAVQESVFPDDFTPTTEAEANALADEALPTFTDEDAPPMPDTEYDDFSDTTALDQKALKDISKALKDVLYLNNKEVKAIADVVQKYSTTEFPDKADLFYELQAKFGTKETVERNEETAAIKKTLREYPINVSQAIKKDITDYGAFMRRNFGKVRFSKEGVPVDSAYQDLSAMFPEYFPADITNASDQLMRIAEVAGMEINETETFELSDEDIMEAVDVIEAEVGKYKEAAVQTAAEADRQAAFAHIDDIAPIRDDIAPAVEIPAPADTSKPIKTVKERLSAKLQNYQTELATNQQQRIDSQASYEEEISRLYAEYSGKKNKNTQVANDILRRIDRLQTMKGNVDADYAKRISDLEAKVAQLTEEVRTGESTTEQAAMRQEVHAAIVDNIKTTFTEKGIDFDTVLANAKDLSTFATVDNTPQRVLEKALGYKEGQILSDLTVNKVAQNETAGIKWLNSFTDKKNGLLAQISKQYHIKPGSKESAAAQMYAEGFYVNKDNEIIQYGDTELAKDFPDVTIQARIKGLAKDPRIRQIYDETLTAINESRARNAYPEIQRLDNYFLHFRAQTDTFSRLGIPFNPKDIKAKDLPTDLNGVTADLKPGQPYFASAMHRQGKRTSFDLLGGLEQYLTGAKDQIYHIDDIQTLRALRNYIADNYGQAKGLDNLDALTEEEAEAKIKEVFNGHLSTMAKFLNEEANVIAGKTSLTDRGLEGVIGRRGITFLADLNKQVGSNMVGFNISSSMTNVLSAVQGFAKTNKVDFVKAMAQYASNKVKSINGKGDSFAEQSPVIVRRKGADRFHRTAWQKTSDAGYWLMGAVDNVSTEIIARAKYNELTRKGMDAQQAHQETDKWVSRLMGDRSLGQQPQLYNSKMLGMLTKFQLEVRNQLDSQFYDTIKEADVATEDIENALKRNSKKAAKITSTFFQLAVAQHLFGKAFESIAGYNPAFDIISVLIKTVGWDDDEGDDDTVLDNIEQGFQELLGDLPYTSTFTGGRIPISSALPIEQLVTGKDDYGNKKSRWETIKETAPYYLLPSGYSQIKKTTQGLGMFDDDLPVAGSYTDSGNLRYPVEETFGNKLQAALFGQYANKNARDYFDNERAPLKEKQIEEYIDLDLPIAEYWKYREGLAKQDTVEEKLDYIDSLDLPIDKKNIMANNVTDRKNPIDMTGYGEYSGLEEFDFATKYPEKYDFFERSGITYEAYATGDEDAREAYNWAYENPEKYTVSQVVTGDVVEYREWLSELDGLTADKDENGNSISGSAKRKKEAYIESLDLDYGQKIILHRSLYSSAADKAQYNRDIVEYLDNREDVSWEEMKTILEELEFTVYDDGTVVW